MNPTLSECFSPTSGASTMHVPAATATHRVPLSEASVHEPGRGQLRIQVELWSVAPGGLQVLSTHTGGLRSPIPAAVGVEACGFIDAVGPDTPGWECGERVSFHASQGFAEYSLCSADQAILLPRKLDSQPVPWGTLGAAIDLIHQARIAPGQTVAIVGLGFLGAILTQLAARKGARVIALSRRSDALAIAHSMGASELLCLGAPQDAFHQVNQWTKNRRCDVVIDATGKPQTLALCELITADCGRIIVAEPRSRSLATIDLQTRNLPSREILRVPPPDPALQLASMRRAVNALCRGELTPARLFTHRFPLEDLDSAFALAKQRREGFIRALILPQRIQARPRNSAPPQFS